MEENRYLTVTALTKYIKEKFVRDVHLKHVLLKGEISNFKHHSRGHFYFTLKDDDAQISAIMFASSAKNVVFRPEDGMSVLVEGRIDVFISSGQYQIYVDKMTEDGLGNLYVAFEQLKKKLEEEGLFDPRHKKPIPKFPKTIGVLTSPTGAAVRDIINIVNRRFPLSSIIVYPTLVQGEFAKDNIVKNIQKTNKDKLVDVIILGRGGGSIEDLWPFNEELVAYEIFKSDIPIISSVGHETDFTISDFVSDLRAPTPSGGAELAVPDQMELLSYLTRLNENSKVSLRRILKYKQDRLLKVEDSYVFRDPPRMFETKSRKLDHLIDKLELLHPKNKIKQGKESLNNIESKLDIYYKQYLTKLRSKYELDINKLELLNPLNIMKKGYSVTKHKGIMIKSVDDVEVGSDVEIMVNDGTLEASIKGKKRS
jgi:exodeoxyribonuclease VII large subunit